jgi:hypothetical protein
LQEAISSDYKNGNIRLREGEYQYDLAKAIASFQLALYFPDVKEIIKKFYGDDKADDIQFIRKIQTILKKMEKNDIVRILPKKKPWELQRYALSSFRFRDSDKNLIFLATDEQLKQTQELVTSTPNQLEVSTKLRNRIYMLVLVLIVSYAAIIWNFMQSVVNPFVFVPAFSIAVIGSIILGEMLSRQQPS